MWVNLWVFLTATYLASATSTDAFSLENLTTYGRYIKAGCRGVLISILILVLVFFVFKISADYSRIMVLIGAGAAVPFMAAARSLTWLHVRRLLEARAYAELIICDGCDWPKARGGMVLSAERAGLVPDPSELRNIERLSELSRNVDRLVVSCPLEKRAAWAELLRCMGIRCEIMVPELDELRPLALLSRDGIAHAVVGEHPLEPHQAIIKRAFDLALTALFSLPLLLVMAATAAAIKLDSPGPVLFKQKRLGFGNRMFVMYKFRSMRVDRQDNEALKLTTRGDDRVTRVGRFIRRTSLDELPQFFNVLKGDMSIVGPRPHAPMALAGQRLYWEVDEKYWRRHVAKPGITGLAQVRGFRGNTFAEADLENRLGADLEYVSDWSLLKDLEILLSTLRVLHHDRAF